ncbi:hypothetical protein ACFWUW_01250 [Streptomyces sp. NPDC058655]|uniref:hypothetical protein n=1 Tax=Streptomyces sp. NPDC058655 TaxID=3346577 RepID=UPI003652B79D
MSESVQDRPEQAGSAAAAAPGTPSAPPLLPLLADGVVELRKRGGPGARRAGRAARAQDSAPVEAAAGDGDGHAAGPTASDPCLEAMARRAAERAGRPRA